MIVEYETPEEVYVTVQRPRRLVAVHAEAEYVHVAGEEQPVVQADCKAEALL